MDLHLDLAPLVRLTTEDQNGQTLAEYGPLVAAIALVVLVAAVFLGSSVTGLFNNVATALGGL